MLTVAVLLLSGVSLAGPIVEKVQPPAPVLAYLAVPAVMTRQGIRPAIDLTGITAEYCYSSDGKTAYMKVFSCPDLDALKRAFPAVTKGLFTSKLATFHSDQRRGIAYR